MTKKKHILSWILYKRNANGFIKLPSQNKLSKKNEEHTSLLLGFGVNPHTNSQTQNNKGNKELE